MRRNKLCLVLIVTLALVTSCASTSPSFRNKDQSAYPTNASIDHHYIPPVDDKVETDDQLLGVALSLLSFMRDEKIRALARTFNDSGRHPYYIYLIMTSGVENISAVRAASDAFMCNFISVKQSGYQNKNVAILMAPLNTVETTNMKSGVDLLNHYDFEKSRALHDALKQSDIHQKGFIAKSNVYLVGSRYSLNLTRTQTPQVTHKLLPKIPHEWFLDESAIDPLLILPLDSYTPGEIGKIFEGVRLRIIDNTTMTVSRDLFANLEEHKAFSYFRRIIDYVPTLISRASANSKACASS